MFMRWRVFLWMAALCSGIGLLVAGAVSYWMPRIYESRAVVEFAPRPEVTGSGWIMDESQRLTGRNVLLHVIEKLDFGKPEGLDPEAALERLRGMITTERVDESSRMLVTLRVQHPEPKLARDLAAEIVAAFGEYRAEISRSEKAWQLRALRELVAQQAQTVAAAQQKLEDAARNLKPEGLPATPTAVEPPKPPMTAQELAEAGRKLAEQTQKEESAFRVTLRERPQLPQSPTWPDIPRNLTTGALAGLAVSPWLALLVVRRRRIAGDSPPAP